MPKDVLVSVLSQNKWFSAYNEWRTKSSVIDNTILRGKTHAQWFSIPGEHNSGNVLFHFNDNSHISTCFRTKICTSGISGLRKRSMEKSS